MSKPRRIICWRSWSARASEDLYPCSWILHSSSNVLFHPSSTRYGLKLQCAWIWYDHTVRRGNSGWGYWWFSRALLQAVIWQIETNTITASVCSCWSGCRTRHYNQLIPRIHKRKAFVRIGLKPKLTGTPWRSPYLGSEGSLTVIRILIGRESFYHSERWLQHRAKCNVREGARVLSKYGSLEFFCCCCIDTTEA